MAKTYQLQTIIAQTLHTICLDAGYVSPSTNPKVNTFVKVKAALESNEKTPPVLEISFTQLGEEIADFFARFEEHPDYKAIIAREDGPMFAHCAGVAKKPSINSEDLTHAVLMTHLYAKLKPSKKRVAKTAEPKLTKPGEYLGVLNQPDNFFVKLVHVSGEDAAKATTFKVVDRNKNVAFFLDRAVKFKDIISLGDCFSITATPTRHVEAPNGEKQTIFRSVEYVPNTLVPGESVAASNDQSDGGVFSKGKSF